MNMLSLTTNPYRRCFLLVSIMFFMLGCNTEEVLIPETKGVAQLPALTPALTEIPMTATDTLTPVPARVTVGGLTTTPIATSTLTPSLASPISPSATGTILPVPTLTESEAESVFEYFMTTNGGCEFPCWWGIKLGDSLESINQRFASLGMPWLVTGSSSKVESDRMGTWDASYYDQQEESFVPRLSVEMQFHELDDSIEYIYVFANRVKFEESQQEFIRDWEQYYLSSILQRVGEPTQVYFRLRNVADPMDPPQFSISLLYLEKGLAITYHVKGIWLHNQDAQAELCLDMENAQAIELSLFNPDNFDIWGYQFAPYHDELYEPLTWEAEMGMSLDTFYETYQNPENLDCLFVSSR